MYRRINCLITILFIVSLLCTSMTHAAGSPLAPTKSGFPSKPITILVGSTPGGGWDMTGRSIQHVLTSEKIVPVPIEVVNKAGAGGTIALAEYVNKKDPYMLLITGTAMVTAIMMNNSPYNFKNVSPLARMITDLEAIAVSADSKYKDFKQLLAAFKKSPKSITWAGGAPGSLDHAITGMMALAAGVNIKDVNYIAFAGSDNVPMVISNRVSAGISGYGEFKPHVQAGRMRFLAFSTPERLSFDPEIPTLKESGLDVVALNWRGVLAAPGIDKEAYAWLVEALTRMQKTKAWKDICVKNGWNEVFMAGEPFPKFVEEEMQKYNKVLKATGVIK